MWITEYSNSLNTTIYNFCSHNLQITLWQRNNTNPTVWHLDTTIEDNTTSKEINAQDLADARQQTFHYVSSIIEEEQAKLNKLRETLFRL